VHSDSRQHTSAALFAAAAVLRGHSYGDIRWSAVLRCAVAAFHRHKQSLIKFVLVPSVGGVVVADLLCSCRFDVTNHATTGKQFLIKMPHIEKRCTLRRQLKLQ